MPTKKKATSRRELSEPTKGDKRYVRRNAKGEFNKVVDVGKSLSSDKRVRGSGGPCDRRAVAD